MPVDKACLGTDLVDDNGNRFAGRLGRLENALDYGENQGHSSWKPLTVESTGCSGLCIVELVQGSLDYRGGRGSSASNPGCENGGQPRGSGHLSYPGWLSDANESFSFVRWDLFLWCSGNLDRELFRSISCLALRLVLTWWLCMRRWSYTY